MNEEKQDDMSAETSTPYTYSANTDWLARSSVNIALAKQYSTPHEGEERRLELLLHDLVTTMTRQLGPAASISAIATWMFRTAQIVAGNVQYVAISEGNVAVSLAK